MSGGYNSSDNSIYLFFGYNNTEGAFYDGVLNYDLSGIELISSPYHTTDPTTVIAQLSWSQTIPIEGAIKFQIRTASNNDNGTPGDFSDDSPNVWTDWCGPDDGVAGSCSPNTYFTDASGAQQIDDIFRDVQNDTWVQYKVYFRPIGMTSAQNPVLNEVTITYAINTEPQITNLSASQNSEGVVVVNYDLADEEESSLRIDLFYDLGITLANDITREATTTISLSDVSRLPTSGTIQIDSEQITYTGISGNTLTGVTRGANNTYFYQVAHSQGAVVWVKAVTVSGDIGTGVTTGLGKTINWTAKTDQDGLYLANTVRVRVVANDGNVARQVGYADSLTFEFDTKDPIVGTTASGATGIDINGNTLTTLGNDKTNTLSVTLNLACLDDTALQMVISNDGLFDTETYQTFATSTDWSLDAFCPDQEYGCQKTVYVKFKDAKGNEIGPYSDTIYLDNNPPTIPGGLFIQDVSNYQTNEFRIFFTWDKNTTEADWRKYEVYRSTDGLNFSFLASNTDVNFNYIVDSGLTQGETYYYKVRSYDDINNPSDFSDVISMVAGGQPNDTVPPTISSVATSTPSTNSITVTWTTDETSTSQVIYSTTDTVPDGSPSQGVSGYDTTHSVTLIGLNSSTTYYFKVKSCDPANNCTESTISQFTTATPDTTPPVISDIAVSSITSDSAIITWTTDKPSTSFVEYSTTAGFTTGDVQGDFSLVTSHSVTLVGLSASTTYYFKVRSTDSSGNEAVSTEQSFSTSGAVLDVTPPAISNVTVASVQYNSATITWTTDENSSSYVEFGLDTSYGRIYGQEELVTSHSIDLPNDLYPETTYHFRVRSIDEAGNEAISSDYTFTTATSPNDTTPPTISNVQIGEPSTTSITITWETNEEADSYIGYSQDKTYTLEQGSPTMTTTHSVTLVGLKPGTLYYFQIKSKDPSGNLTIDNNSGQGYQFATETSTTNPPVISDIQISNVSHNSATIIWTTDKSSTSFVEYGFDTSYGNSQGDFSFTTSHSVTLVGLLSEATYHFRVRSTDSDNNEAVSQDYTFTTESAPDITPPTISNVQITNIGLTSADISWETNEPANSLIDYGTDVNNLTNLAGDATTYTLSHTVSLTDLSPGTTYYFQIRSQDQSGNWATDNNGGNYYSFTTTADTVPPTISDVTVAVVDRNSATITWTTNEPATSQVEYSLNSDLSSSLLTTEITDLRQQHSVVISNLTANTTYYYRAISKDAAGNQATSTISSFTTAQEKEDITPPTISNVSVSNITTNSATITWTTDENSNSIVDYGTSESLGLMAGNVGELVTSHSVTLTGLSVGTTYYFQVRSQDASGNMTTDNNSGNYYTFTTKTDSTPPIISNVNVAVVSDNSAAITWTTDEESTSQVVYGLDINYGNQTLEDRTLTKTHAVVLSGLSIQTQYYFKVISKDLAGNIAEDDNNGQGYTFQTTKVAGEIILGGGVAMGKGPPIDVQPPRITKVEVVEVTHNSAKIRWQTDENTSGIVEYGTTQEYGNIEGSYEVTGTGHEVLLRDLLPNTIYHFRVVSLDALGNISKSLDDIFKTEPISEEVREEESGILPPVLGMIKKITSPQGLTSVFQTIEERAQATIEPPIIAGEYPKVEPDETSAKIIWITDKEADSIVAYASADEYDPTKEEPYKYIIGNTEEFVTYHLVELTGLKPSTLYHFQVRSKPKIGPEGRSKDFTFFTKSVSPEITNLKITKVENDAVEFSWETNVPTNVIVEYTNLETGETLAQGDPNFVTKHTFRLQNLVPNTNYSAIIICRDEFNNEIKSDRLKFTTGKDEIPPEITQVRADSTLYPGKEARVQTIITWQTNEPATSQVFWQEGIIEGAQMISTPKDLALTTKHVVVITKFKPSTVYKFWVESEDATGNKSKSREFTILTPKREETVVEIIIKNFENIFDWMKFR
jgi:hypothetical protein